MKHSRTPWTVVGSSIFDADGEPINEYSIESKESDADHAVACVNACAGFKPEAVGKIIKSLKDCLEMGMDNYTVNMIYMKNHEEESDGG